MTKDEARAGIMAACRKYVDDIATAYKKAQTEFEAAMNHFEATGDLFTHAEKIGISAEIEAMVKELEELG